uniref:Uncharacterized protein n=1 Tax=Setaria italica TaxID=4555 RepID=K3YXL0_SETIT
MVDGSAAAVAGVAWLSARQWLEHAWVRSSNSRGARAAGESRTWTTNLDGNRSSRRRT